jgi:hypothetical protein
MNTCILASDLQALGYIRNVSLAEASFVEAETRQVYSDFPYQGFIDVNATTNMVKQCSPRPFYIPMHHIAPACSLGPYLDVDLYADPSSRV